MRGFVRLLAVCLAAGFLTLSVIVEAGFSSSRAGNVRFAPSGVDTDGDGLDDADPTELDIDGDGVANSQPPSGTDADACPFLSDCDFDGIADNLDGSPQNPDVDGDGILDGDDDDIDGDGIANADDANSFDATLSGDIDGDGIDDSVDTDRDGDGLANSLDPDPDTAGAYTDQPQLAAFDGSSVIWSGSTHDFSTYVSAWVGSGSTNWRSNTESVCTVAADGTVTKIADGSCEVVADRAFADPYRPASATFTLSVTLYNPPTVVAGSFGDQNANLFESFSYDISGNFNYDSGSVSRSYSLVSPPDWLSIDSTSGVISGTPEAGDSGGAVTVRFDDGQGTTRSVVDQTFNLYVYGPRYRTSTYEYANMSGWPVSQSNVAYSGVNRTDNTRDKLLFFYSAGTNQNTAANRKSFAQATRILGASNLANGTYDTNGLRDSSGNLIILAADNSDEGYLLVGIGSRTGASGWDHAILQFRPLGDSVADIGGLPGPPVYLGASLDPGVPPGVECRMVAYSGAAAACPSGYSMLSKDEVSAAGSACRNAEAATTIAGTGNAAYNNNWVYVRTSDYWAYYDRGATEAANSRVPYEWLRAYSGSTRIYHGVWYEYSTSGNDCWEICNTPAVSASTFDTSSSAERYVYCGLD